MNTLALQHDEKVWGRIRRYAKRPSTCKMVKLFAKRENLSHKQAATLFLGALQFLYACRQANLAGSSCAPSEDVDKAWHYFILNTMQYAEFCEKYVGFFVHHIPLGHPDKDAYERTRYFVQSYLGESPAFPLQGSAICCCNGDCPC